MRISTIVIKHGKIIAWWLHYSHILWDGECACAIDGNHSAAEKAIFSLTVNIDVYAYVDTKNMHCKHYNKILQK